MSRLFGTDGIRGIANREPMTAETVVKIGRVIGDVFKKENKKIKFIIGKDTRISGDMLENAIISGIVSSGINVFKLGVVSTPAVAFLSSQLADTIGAVISASHNPLEDNGLKFFSNNGFKLSDNIERKIESLVISKHYSADNLPTGSFLGRVVPYHHLLTQYENFLLNTISGVSLKNFKIVVDCANGANYEIAPRVLKKLGAKIIPLNCNPNGVNINYKCGALFPDVAANAVRKEKASVGLSFDGDGDRVIMCDENGKIVNGDHIIAIYADYYNKNKNPKIKTVIGTIMSNIGLELFLKKINVEFVRAKVGDRYVLEEMLKRKSFIGGEQSGHIILLNKGVTGDGLLTALQILAIMKETKKPLSELASCFKNFPQILVNIKVKEKKELKNMPKVRESISKVEKILSGSGRVNFRYSGTENLARIMLEGTNKKMLFKLSKQIADSLKREIE